MFTHAHIIDFCPFFFLTMSCFDSISDGTTKFTLECSYREYGRFIILLGLFDNTDSRFESGDVSVIFFDIFVIVLTFLSIFFFILLIIPGGFLAYVFPANRIFGAAIFTSAVLNLIVPSAMKLDNITILLLIRFAQGLVEVRMK